ncbi:MAG: tape measure protein, partial [Tannerella sp.]|nr:tape measure protein [Tannerella sp.]
MNEPVDIEFRINADALEIQSRQAVNSILGVGRAGREAEGGVYGLSGRLKTLLAGFAGTAALSSFVHEIVNVRGEIQALESSFEVLLGNKRKADAMLAAIKDYAVESPLSLSGVSNAAQTLLSFNIEAEKVIPTIKQIGDVSMGNEEKFRSLILAFAQMSSTGRLMGQDLLQMINAGFNPLAVIAEKTGKSIGELKKEMETGAISAEMVADAFASAAAEGGKFYGMTAKQAEGIKGLRAELEGAIQEKINEIGEASEGVISSAYRGTTGLVENYEKVGKVLLSLVATYGAYKAAVIAVTVTEKLRYQAALAHTAGMTTMQAVTDVLRAKMEALNKTMLANPYVLATTAIVGLAAVMWTLHDSSSAAERALKDYNEKREAARKAEEEH